MYRIPLVPMSNHPIFYVPDRANEAWAEPSTGEMHTTRRWRASSASSASQHRTAKRRRSTILFWGRRSPSEGDVDYSQPVTKPPRRSSSLLSWFSFGSRRSSKDKMPVRDEPEYEQPIARRKSSFAKLRDFITKRKDSGTASSPVEFDQYPPGIFDSPHEHGEASYYNASYEMQMPGRRNSILQFQSTSPYDNDEAGPSRYYRGRPYYDRPCTVLSQSVYSTSESEWDPERAVPMRATNAEAGDGLTSNSHAGPSRQHTRQNSIRLSTPNFFRAKPSKRMRQLNGATASQNSGEIRRKPARAHSVFSTRRFRANPAPFGSGPNLRLRSIEELGVLPLIEEPSLENELEIPHPTYSYPNAASPSSSTVAIHTRSAPDSARSSSRAVNLCAQCLPSASTDPAKLALPPSPSPSTKPTSSTAPPIHQSSEYLPGLGMETTASDPPSRVPSVFDVVDSPARSPKRSSTATAVDEPCEQDQGLELTRMKQGVDDVFARSDINGEGNMGWEGGFAVMNRPDSRSLSESGENSGKGRTRMKRF
ncbi:hypothetical protein P280DRAFT_474211 [Massarina eburnea CBS 473.64]|uniref:Uncharacterized protein n=1 Tax=Massarina eburnea CBS 473.64 TaxID=1395130 RepID=A0A6A6RHE8_9PLEO|nr:hypothetical protein P280DRAFT_474211 [Massarina eburnea CBS 473.64]